MGTHGEGVYQQIVHIPDLENDMMLTDGKGHAGRTGGLASISVPRVTVP